ncbi:MAG: hypothetical protein HQL76_03295 [Magnetococcales bacterium]|nr:hypothetical protein [Magnetococcales bacterium]
MNIKWTMVALASLSFVAVSQTAWGRGSDWNSDFGPVHLDINPDGSVSGRYTNYQGTLAGQVAEDGSLRLLWLQPTSERRCHTPQVGTRYWGRLTWRSSDDGNRLWGEWSYCDEAPGSGGQWNATLRRGSLP